MNVHRGLVALVAVVSLLQGTGCSWLFVNKPPEPPVNPAPPVVCTTSVGAPVADTILGAAALGVGIAGIVYGTRSKPPCTSWCIDIGSGFDNASAIAGGVLVAAAIPLAFSAGYGYSTTAECRQLADAQLACLSGVEASCARLRPGPAPGAPANVGAPCSGDADCTGGGRCLPSVEGKARCVGPAPAP